MNETLTHTFFPELGEQIQQKVHGTYNLKNDVLMIANDRIFVFDKVLSNCIPDRGRIYTQLILFWFEKTKDIIQNHIIFSPDPNVIIVKKYTLIPIIMVVRKYACGSLWRDYQEKKQVKCGMKLPGNLYENQELENPIITPIIQNEKGYLDFSKQQILQEKIVDEKLYSEMEKKAYLLFQRGEEILRKNKIILADAKYRFGLDEDSQLILIGEIHTPDSSRVWFEKDSKKRLIQFPDKEYVRSYNIEDGYLADHSLLKFPNDIQKKMHEGYIKIFEILTGQKFPSNSLPVKQRILTRLKNAKIIQGMFISILAADKKDQNHIDKITVILNENKIPYRVVFVGAQSDVHQHLDLFNQSLEPVVYIMIDSESFQFSKMGALKSKWPVICTASFEMELIDSSLLHTKVPVLTVSDPTNAAISALKLLRSLEREL